MSLSRYVSTSNPPISGSPRTRLTASASRAGAPRSASSSCRYRPVTTAIARRRPVPKWSLLIGRLTDTDLAGLLQHGRHAVRAVPLRVDLDTVAGLDVHVRVLVPLREEVDHVRDLLEQLLL